MYFHSTNRLRSSEAEATSTFLWTERKSELEGWKHSNNSVHHAFVDHFSSAPISAAHSWFGLREVALLVETAVMHCHNLTKITGVVTTLQLRICHLAVFYVGKHRDEHAALSFSDIFNISQFIGNIKTSILRHQKAQL